GFFSTNEKRDGAFRKLTVRVKKPGFTARSRTGYYAPKS
ncbi:MAG: VWA domain-containing protein, partial [Acidobacteria bacterium]|nr:VWA domain-containing protein [Acidobacteriota bacterium]